MSVYRAELRRLAKRRMTRYVGLAAVLVLAAVAMFVFTVNQKIGPEDRAEAASTAEEFYQSGVRSAEAARAACAQAAEDGRQQPGFPADCADTTPVDRADYKTEYYLPETFTFRTQFPMSLSMFAAVLAMAALAIGASFVGVEWTTGGMTTLLLWRPRRQQVLAAKLAALLTGTAVLTAVLTVVWTAVMWLVAVVHGDTTGVTGAVWGSLLLTALRGLVLVGVAAAVGFALAWLGRGTALALGGVLGVGIVGQTAVAFLSQMANVRYPDLWLLPTYADAWMNRAFKAEPTITGSCGPGVDQCGPGPYLLTWQTTGLAMAVVVVALVGGAMWATRSRDIT